MSQYPACFRHPLLIIIQIYFKYSYYVTLDSMVKPEKQALLFTISTTNLRLKEGLISLNVICSIKGNSSLPAIFTRTLKMITSEWVFIIIQYVQPENRQSPPVK